MALTTYNITGNLEDAFGAKALLGEVTFMPAGTTEDARVDGADAMLGPIRYSIADLPSPMALTEGAWVIAIRPTGRVNGEAQFRTKTIPWNMTAATTWGEIVASAADPVPLPAPTFDESVAGVLGTGGQTDTALKETFVLPTERLTKSSDRPRLSIARKVHDAPPTIGAERTASAIVSGKKWSPLTGGGGTTATVDPTAPFKYVGGFDPKLFKYSGQPVGSAPGFPNYNYVASSHLTTPNTANPVQAISFGFDGTELEINLRTVGGQSYRLMVDGEYVGGVGAVAITTVGQVWLPVTFATRKPRVITVETYNTPWGGVVTGPNDTVWKPEPSGPRVVVMGDSYTGGTGADSYLTGYVATFRDVMGWRDVVFSGSGGTGYLTVGVTGTTTFRGRVQNDVIDLDPDVVIIAGGHNDYPTYTQAQIEAEAKLLFETIHAALPDAHIFVVGPYAQGASDAEYASTVGVWIQNAVNAANAAKPGTVDAFVPAAGWFTGTGKVGATTGSGNSDLYISGDGVHPTQAGHDYMGYRLAEALSAKLPA